MIVRVAGAAPIRGRQPLYFLDEVFLARAKVPAPPVSDRFGFGLEHKTAAKMEELKKDEEAEANDGGEPKLEAQLDRDQGGREGGGAEPEMKPPSDHDRGERENVVSQPVEADRVEGGAEPQPQEQPESGQSVETEVRHEIQR